MNDFLIKYKKDSLLLLKYICQYQDILRQTDFALLCLTAILSTLQGCKLLKQKVMTVTPVASSSQTPNLVSALISVSSLWNLLTWL